MLSSPKNLMVVPGGGGGGQGGKARGNSAGSILNYAQDVRAANYYGEEGRAKSAAMGVGWQDLGLPPGEEPSREQLENLLEGRGLNGEELARIKINKEGEIRAGIDLTFSAPKTVSAAWALADAETRQKIEAAFEKSVSGSIGWIEEQGYVSIRRGRNGTDRAPASKLSVMSYFHKTSRPEDPQIHAHAILFNIAQDQEKNWYRIDAADVFRHKIEIGAVQRAILADELVKLGFTIERDRTSFAITGISDDLVTAWSKGGQAIQEQLAEWGTAGSKAAQAAAYAVRAKEKLHTSADELDARWEAEAAELGISKDEIAALRQDIGAGVEYDESAVISGLSATNATFSDLDLRKAVAIGMNAGGGGLDEIRQAMQKIKSNEQLIELVDAEGKTRWTTKEMREIEQELVANIDARRGQAKPIPTKTIEWAIEEAQRLKGFAFNDEQKTAVRVMIGSDSRDRFVTGAAGAGKSTVALAVKLAMDREGREVFGMALASKAATGLGDGTGMTTSTIDSFLYSVDQGYIKLKPDSLIVVDESNMSDTRQIAKLVTLAKEHKADVALIGDSKQLQAIQAGSVFAYLYDRADEKNKAEIATSTRQRGAHANEWRGFLHGIRDGQNKEVLGFLDRLGNLKISAEQEEVKDAVEKWKFNKDAGLPDADNIFVTNRNDMRRRLNDAAREIAGQAARPDNVEIKTVDREGNSTGKRSFAPGDRVITLKNDKRLKIPGTDDKQKVDNGSVWTIEDIKQIQAETVITMRSDADRRVQFCASEYSSLDHGYALTVHQSEGVTTTGLVGLPSDLAMMDLHSWYVMLTRARNAEYTHVVIPNHILDEAEAVHGVESKEGANYADRLDGLLKAVERQRYDHLSISMKTKEEHQAQERDQAVKAAAVTEDQQSMTSGRRASKPAPVQATTNKPDEPKSAAADTPKAPAITTGRRSSTRQIKTDEKTAKTAETVDQAPRIDNAAIQRAEAERLEAERQAAQRQGRGISR